MIPMYIILGVLLLHWIGDFVCQSDWMAKNKSKNNVALLFHVGTYYLVILVGLWLFIPTDLYYSGALLFATVNGVLHFITDYITSRMTSRLYAKGEIHNFFVVVGFDQLIHLATFVYTIPLFLMP